jgi:predicted transcriptional regulator
MKTRVLSIRVPYDTAARLELLAAVTDRSTSDMAAEAIELYLESHQKTGDDKPAPRKKRSAV